MFQNSKWSSEYTFFAAGFCTTDLTLSDGDLDVFAGVAAALAFANSRFFFHTQDTQTSTFVHMKNTVTKFSDTLESFLSKENLHACHENFRNFSSFERNFHN